MMASGVAREPPRAADFFGRVGMARMAVATPLQVNCDLKLFVIV